MKAKTFDEKNAGMPGELVKSFEKSIPEGRMEQLLRQSGAFKRKPRKLTAQAFLKGLLASAFESVPTLESIAGILSLVAGCGYTKQAAWKRMNSGTMRFLISLLQLLFQQIASRELPAGIFAPFSRVLVQDSTSMTLPKRYGSLYPGSDNQHGSNSVMKFQVVMELLSCRIADLSISSHRRNDQTATGDIFTVARSGDLVLRDLGYFCYDSFSKMSEQGVFFIARLCGQIPVLDPDSLEELELSQELSKAGGVFDRVLLIGKKKKVPVRLVAMPAPEEVANERRRKAYGNKDKRYSPLKERLRLMSWNIMITNVPSEMLSSSQVVKAYYFRWRIEIMFKSWKSMLSLERLNFHSVQMLHISVALKLLLCVFAQATAFNLELLATAHGENVSALRLARTIGDLKPLLMLHMLDVSPAAFLAYKLKRHSFYERRKDRMNFFERIYEDAQPISLG